MNDTPQRLEAEDFIHDPHARKYRGQLDDHPLAFERLFDLLNDPANEFRLIDAELYDKPALAGVVQFIEDDPAIAPVLEQPRFRQTVGVAVKLKMAKLGWQKTGRKGIVTGARYFRKAERYTRHLDADPGYAATTPAALKTAVQTGDENERTEAGHVAMGTFAKAPHELGFSHEDEVERILLKLAPKFGGRSGAIRQALHNLEADRDRQAALRSFVDEWNAEAGPVDEDAVAAMAERYGL